MLKEFREFIAKGNVVDLAVGVIIGAAFGAIVNSLVKDVIMPPIALLMGKVDFSNLHAVLKEGDPAGPYASLDAATKAGAVTLNYGAFINAVISFLIVSWAVFVMVKAVNKIKREPEPAPEAPAEPTPSEVLLAEIRDVLKSR